MNRTLEAERAELRRREQEHIQIVQQMLAERTQRQQEELSRSQAMSSFERELSMAVEAMGGEVGRGTAVLAPRWITCCRVFG